MLIAPAWDRGVWHPRGLLDLVDPAAEEALRSICEGRAESEVFRRATAIADGQAHIDHTASIIDHNYRIVLQSNYSLSCKNSTTALLRQQ